MFFSNRWKEILGYDDEEFENEFSVFTELLNDEDKPRVNKEIENYLSGKVKNYEIEFRLRTKDGGYKWILARGKVLKDSNGIPIRFADSHTDTHEKKLQQIYNEELERRWEFALDGSGDGIWDWNSKTNEVYYSKRWKEMLGYDDSDIGNAVTEWQERIHADHKEEVNELFNNHIYDKSEIYVSKHRMLCKDGTYKWILDRGKVIERDVDGVPLRIIGTHTNIDELIKTQNELERQSILLNDAQEIAQMGAWELDLETGKTFWTDEVYKIHEVDFDFDHNKVNGMSFIILTIEKLYPMLFRILLQLKKLFTKFVGL